MEERKGRRMLQVGDYVVSSTNGICKIEEEIRKDWSGKDTLYYVLIPLNEKGSKVYVPVDHAEQRMRKAMNDAEAREFIEKLKEMPELPIQNEKFCDKEYKSAVYSGDPVILARVIKTIYMKMQARYSSGKKVTAVDDRYFKAATHILFSELAHALGCRENEVEDKIGEMIEHKEKR